MSFIAKSLRVIFFPCNFSFYDILELKLHIIYVELVSCLLIAINLVSLECCIYFSAYGIGAIFNVVRTARIDVGEVLPWKWVWWSEVLDRTSPIQHCQSEQNKEKIGESEYCINCWIKCFKDTGG